jgi:hypothetical protein
VQKFACCTTKSQHQYIVIWREWHYRFCSVLLSWLQPSWMINGESHMNGIYIKILGWMLNVIICIFREGHFVTILFFIHIVLNRSTLKKENLWNLLETFPILFSMTQINHSASSISLSLHPLCHNWLTLKTPQFFMICRIKHLLWQFESIEYHILAIFIVIMRFHSKTYCKQIYQLYMLIISNFIMML